jgi:hypothetical protein
VKAIEQEKPAPGTEKKWEFLGGSGWDKLAGADVPTPGSDSTSTAPPADTAPAPSPPADAAPTSAPSASDAEREKRYAMPYDLARRGVPWDELGFPGKLEEYTSAGERYGRENGTLHARKKASEDWGKLEDPQPLPVTYVLTGDWTMPLPERRGIWQDSKADLALSGVLEAHQKYAEAYLAAYRSTYDSGWRSPTRPTSPKPPADDAVSVHDKRYRYGYFPSLAAWLTQSEPKPLTKVSGARTLLSVGGVRVLGLRAPLRLTA